MNFKYSSKVIGQTITSFLRGLEILSGTPKIEFQPYKMIVVVPYFTPKNAQVLQLSNDHILALGKTLRHLQGCSGAIEKSRQPTSSVLKGHQKSYTLELRLARLLQPYLNADILRQYISINADKYNFARINKSVFNSRGRKGPSYSATDSKRKNINETIFPGLKKIEESHANGPFSEPLPFSSIKIELAGRLTTQQNVPRKTVENAQLSLNGARQFQTVGNISEVSLDTKKGLSRTEKRRYNKTIAIGQTVKKKCSLSSDFSQYTAKNKLGTYTIKV